MNFALRGFLIVPLIAVMNGLAMALISLYLDRAGLTWNWGAFGLLFWITTIMSLAVGLVLAGPALAIGKYLPRPKLPWLLLIGLFLGPIPIVLLDASGALVVETLATFSALGLLSALLWWALVERYRPIDVPRSA